jgi:peptidoglycan hydrolase-like protein with peptidoglycan-binding domain
MGQRSKARVRGVIEESQGVRPGAAALGVFGVGLASMIVYNAFFGIHGSGAHGTNRGVQGQRLTVIPEGATTRAVVNVPQKQSKSVTITYNADVEDVQRELLATGHYRGLVDGVMGKQTAIAIKKYQADSGLAVTGEISADLIDHIRYKRKVLAASEFTGSVSKAPAVEPKKVIPAPAPKGLAKVREAQRLLKKLGYDLLTVSGEIDEPTKSALLKFQMDYGLAMDGGLSKELMAALKVAEAGAALAAQ